MEQGKRKTIVEHLTKLENLLLARSSNLSGQDQGRLSSAIDQLKEVLYSIDEIAITDSSAAERLNNDMPTLVDRLTSVIDGTSSNGLITVLTQIQGYYDYFSKVSQSSGQKTVDQLNAAKEQIKQYQLQEETRKKAEAAESKAKKQLDKVRSAEATKEWSAYYEKYVTCEGHGGIPRGKRAWWGRLFYWGENFYLLERKWVQWRSIWLGTIAVLSFSLGVWIAIQLQLGVDFPIVLGEKAAFIPVYVVLGIGFAFASRNYRINTNLLADYRHKQIVAKILENVVASNAFEEKDGMKLEMLQQGAKALFTPKKVGHLNKESVEEFPIIELVKAIKKIK
ncbi:MAG TPA: hypothetical protein VLF60_01795 [Candidatus Saccharimonadales bacterium]|nr:hypothetical protein [Candidatus Saccharimonadales bacterium]